MGLTTPLINKCSNCGKYINKIGVMAFTLNKKRRYQCIDCAANKWKKIDFSS